MLAIDERKRDLLATGGERAEDSEGNFYKSDLLKSLLMSKMQQGWLHHLIQPMLCSGGCGGSRPENSFEQVVF